MSKKRKKKSLVLHNNNKPLEATPRPIDPAKIFAQDGVVTEISEADYVKGLSVGISASKLNWLFNQFSFYISNAIQSEVKSVNDLFPDASGNVELTAENIDEVIGTIGVLTAGMLPKISHKSNYIEDGYHAGSDANDLAQVGESGQLPAKIIPAMPISESKVFGFDYGTSDAVIWAYIVAHWEDRGFPAPTGGAVAFVNMKIEDGEEYLLHEIWTFTNQGDWKQKTNWIERVIEDNIVYSWIGHTHNISAQTVENEIKKFATIKAIQSQLATDTQDIADIKAQYVKTASLQALVSGNTTVKANDVRSKANESGVATNKADIAKNTAKEGIPVGGTTGQSLVKKTDTDGDVEWKNGSGDGARLPVGVLVPFYYDIPDRDMRLLGIEPCNGASIVTNKDDIYFSLWGAIKTTYGGRGDIGGGDFEFKVPPDNVEGVFHRAMGSNAGAFGEKQEDAIKKAPLQTDSISYDIKRTGGFALMTAPYNTFSYGYKNIGGGTLRNVNAGNNDGSEGSSGTLFVGREKETRPINRVVKVGIVYIKSSQPLPAPPANWSVDGIPSNKNNVDLTNDPVILDMIEENATNFRYSKVGLSLTKDTKYTANCNMFIYISYQYTNNCSFYLKVGTLYTAQDTGSTTWDSGVTVFIPKGETFSYHFNEAGGPTTINGGYALCDEDIKPYETQYAYSNIHNQYAGECNFGIYTPKNYTLIEPNEEMEDKCQIFTGAEWQYRIDPYPTHRQFCKWTEAGYELDASKKDNLISVISDKVKSQTENNISTGLWLDEGEEVEFTSTYEHLRFTNISDAKSFITSLKTKTMEELIELLSEKTIKY